MPQSKLDNYNSARGAAAYRCDYARKVHRRYSDARERRIFARFFARTGRVGSLLDLPCGFGRLFGLFWQNADRVIEADWSKTMLDLNRRDHAPAAAGFVRCTALAIPLRDRAVDAAVSVRLSHHLESLHDREQHLQELMRVADRYVIASYFSFHSVKNTLRRLRAPLDRKRPKNTLRASQVDAIAAACGFRRIAAARVSRIASGHVFVLLRRI
jgi:ubiquinone/menaquinone biosynthesis C-methylase UbiE